MDHTEDRKWSTECSMKNVALYGLCRNIFSATYWFMFLCFILKTFTHINPTSQRSETKYKIILYALGTLGWAAAGSRNHRDHQAGHPPAWHWDTAVSPGCQWIGLSGLTASLDLESSAVARELLSPAARGRQQRDPHRVSATPASKSRSASLSAESVRALT